MTPVAGHDVVCPCLRCTVARMDKSERREGDRRQAAGLRLAEERRLSGDRRKIVHGVVVAA